MALSAGGALHADTAVVVRVDLRLAPATVEALACHLDDEEQQRAARLRDPARRRRFVVAHAALRSILADRLGTSANTVSFVAQPCANCGKRHGKPTLSSQHASELKFNLSHSGELAVVAVDPRDPVGVDVERVRHDLDVERLAERFLDSKVARIVGRSGDRHREFFGAWTRAEAVLKATGEGVGVLPLGVGLDARVRRFQVVELAVPPGYAGALATTPGRRVVVCDWSLPAVAHGPGFDTREERSA